MRERSLDDLWTSREPLSGAAPLVLDSPHSGRVYPEDFGYAAPFEALRRTEDAYVDRLFEGAARRGAGFLAALFPRSYVDPNRHETEIDPLLLADPWPGEIRPSERAEKGLGVVRRLIGPRLAVYDRLLPSAEIQSRIERYHRPYHEQLQAMLDATHARFGQVWHLNCHSMKAMGRGRNGAPAPIREDFVLGDLDGESCDPAFRDLVAEELRAMGYSVAINAPFRGAELVTRHGLPAQGRHSLQMEINRRLYLDEMSVTLHAGFDRLRADLDRLVARIVDFTASEAEAAE
ncbi:MAG TPA: N-formylglutamate amidohydrolase [Hypericibacter adhaerens]|uniref:N-formylglutamate amidohydrolase n=1 Tax=Hypericibacter adhaerens TaxID=2602016 RepID=UPI002CC57610|nr:N-formylglutamate amidohydrolase [Hypericibacter adhaerens]HWA41658.1 N-formylglutamate amidohydrolase [Hypericibacter adhaerens]